MLHKIATNLIPEYEIILFNYLDPTLFKLYKNCNRKFTKPTKQFFALGLWIQKRNKATPPEKFLTEKKVALNFSI